MLRALKLTGRPHIRLYNGYGNQNHCIIFGHLLSYGPIPRKKYRRNFFTNTFALIRLFILKPLPDREIILTYNDETYQTTTAADGFFRFEWQPAGNNPPGWHEATASWKDPASGHVVSAKAKVYVPHNNYYSFISDIDDTFLISHSSNLRKRLWVLLTENARSRKPFDDVVMHYEYLASASAPGDTTNPFFYVSSSEWNLYDYIREFCSVNRMPQGVFLLNQIKQLHEVFKTGQTKHNGKFFRIVRVINAFPDEQFVLLGDDSQQDPGIYASIIKHFPGKIHAVYLRKVHKSPSPEVEVYLNDMRKTGVHVCYFRHSREAIDHSRSIQLIR